MIGNWKKPTQYYKKFISWCVYNGYPIEYREINTENDWKSIKSKFIYWNEYEYRVKQEFEDYYIHLFETGINA